jgi:hypothetical protein
MKNYLVLFIGIVFILFSIVSMMPCLFGEIAFGIKQTTYFFLLIVGAFMAVRSIGKIVK